MKVLHCITGLTSDGAQSMLLRLVAGLRARDISSHIVNLGDATAMSQSFLDIGVPVESLSLSPTIPDAMRGIRRIRAIVQDTSPTLLQGWMYHSNILLTFASTRRGRVMPLLWNIRRGLDDFHERGLGTRCVVRAGAWFSKGVDRIIYCSRQSRVQHEDFGFYPGRGEVLENGFDTERFARSEEKRDAFRSHHGLAPEDLVIGNIGRFDVAKGHLYLLEAFAEVTRLIPRARLVLVGRHMDWSNTTITTAITQAGLSSKVCLLGEKEHVENIYPGFDAYCSASLSEGFPNALSEAMACEVPCVATDTGASRELVQGIGQLVASRDSRELANALVFLLQKSTEQRRTTGELLRERIVRQFGLEGMVDRYHTVYSEVLRQFY